MEKIYIYGKHAVTEAVRKRPDVVVAVYAKASFYKDAAFKAQAERTGQAYVLEDTRLPREVPPEAVHQGIVAVIDVDKLLVPDKEYLKGLEADANTALLVLGEIQDPHNVGAVIRSAAAFGAAAVLIPEHRQAPVTGTVVKVSAGMAFSIPLVSVPNVNRTLRSLKDKGFWVYGLADGGDTSLHNEQFTRASAFVLGNEGDGLRQKTAELCDNILTIPMHPRAESLNASVSAATVLYQWSTQHPSALQ